MKINDKILSFDEGKREIHIFVEGMFAKLYNESAYLFTTYIRQYRVNITTSKSLNSEYYSLGFPQNMIKHFLSDCEIITIEDNYFVVKADKFLFDKEKYQTWCENSKELYSKRAVNIKDKNIKEEKVIEVLTSNSKSTALDSSEKVITDSDLIIEIYNFRIENATPMECMIFLNNLQKKIYGKLSKSTSL